MHTLVGTFQSLLPIDEGLSAQGQGCWPVKIMFPDNLTRTIYLETEKDQHRFLKALKETTMFRNIDNDYEFKFKIAQGSYGVINKAVHKLTGEEVVIKKISKEEMDMADLYQQRLEVEILKICQHKGTALMKDYYEDADYIYIVMEYIKGRDLFDYLKYNNTKMTEQKAKEIAYHILLGIQYLHTYGIIHRDLKLENIMMTDKTDSALPVLVDFGLATVIGPGQRATESSGTVGYCAPEVLSGGSYEETCDLWSFGCVVHVLMSGCLPFEASVKQEVMRMTIQDPVTFKQPIWSRASPEVRDLVKSLLVKDPEERLTISEALAHPWFRSINK